MRPGLVALGVILLLLAPALAAGAPTRASLASTRALALAGDVELSSTEGMLNLSHAAQHGGIVRLSWAAATGHHVVRDAQYARGTTLVLDSRTVRNDSLRLGAGGLENVSCPARCRLLLFAEGEGVLALRGAADGALAPRAEPYPHVAGGEPDVFRYYLGEGWLEAGAAPGAIAMREDVASAEGRLGLLLFGVEADVVEADRRERLVTGYRVEPRGNVAERAATEHRVSEFVVLHLAGARVEASPGSRALLSAPRLDVRLAGALRAEGADGWVRVGGERTELADASLLWEGELAGALAGQADLLDGSAGAPELAGDSTRLLVDGASVAAPAPPAAAERALEVGVGLAVLAVLARVALWVAFSRISPERLLENERRRAIFEAVKARPGASIAELARAVGVTATSARYHVQRLEARGLLETRWEGRARYVHVAGSERAALEARLARATEVGARRSILAALAAQGDGLTQADLAARTGLSQRLVSYHLGWLRRGGLVAAVGSRPARYVPEEIVREKIGGA